MLKWRFCEFHGIFWWFLDGPSPAQSLTPSFFSEMQGAKVVHMLCKFHLHLTCSSWLFSVQMFFYLQKVGIKPPSISLSFPVEEERYIRESPPFLPKLHPGVVQIFLKNRFFFVVCLVAFPVKKQKTKNT